MEQAYAIQTSWGFCEATFSWLGLRSLSLPLPVPINTMTAEQHHLGWVQGLKAYLQVYMAGGQAQLTIPLDIRGTDFQQRVWRQVQNIPYGLTVCYQKIAEQVGQAKACRAVGQAVGRNPLPIVIPCHRVVGQGGQLTGYSGGLIWKKRLLALEQSDHQV